MLFMLGPYRVISATISIPWRGCWVADVVLDPDVPVDPPGGAKLPLVLGENTPLLGTIDGDDTGSFGGVHKARVVGGLGWRKELGPQHFYNPAILLSPQVIVPTAAAVLEVATVLVPTPLGTDYVRHAGVASKVLDGLDWHVELVGTTTIGPRLPKPINPLDVEVLSYDPSTRTLELGGNTIVEPGSLIPPDPIRGLNEILTVRHVEIEIGPGGFKTRARCGDAPSEAGDAIAVLLTRLVRHIAKSEFSRFERYRVALPAGGGKWMLQACDLGEKADLLPAKIWPGMAGLSAELVPGSIVLVGWGKDQDPQIVAYDDTAPISLSLDAILGVSIGGATALPVVQGPGLATAISAAAASANLIVGTVSGAALGGILTTLASAIAAASTKKTIVA